MFGTGSGFGRLILPAAAVPIVASTLSQNDINLVNSLAIGMATGMVVWGLIYALMSRGGK